MGHAAVEQDAIAGAHQLQAPGGVGDRRHAGAMTREPLRDVDGIDSRNRLDLEHDVVH